MKRPVPEASSLASRGETSIVTCPGTYVSHSHFYRKLPAPTEFYEIKTSGVGRAVRIPSVERLWRGLGVTFFRAMVDKKVDLLINGGRLYSPIQVTAIVDKVEISAQSQQSQDNRNIRRSHESSNGMNGHIHIRQVIFNQDGDGQRRTMEQASISLSRIIEVIPSSMTITPGLGNRQSTGSDNKPGGEGRPTVSQLLQAGAYQPIYQSLKRTRL